MSAQAASRPAGQKEMGPVFRLHTFSVLQVTVEGDVRMLIQRDFILACLEEKGTDIINNEVFSFFINERSCLQMVRNLE